MLSKLRGCEVVEWSSDEAIEEVIRDLDISKWGALS